MTRLISDCDQTETEVSSPKLLICLHSFALLSVFHCLFGISFFKCQFPRVHLKLSSQKVIISPCRAFITTCYNQCCPLSPISLSVSQRTNYNQKLLISVLLRSSSQRSSLLTTFLSKTLMLITLAANTMMKHGNHQGAA